MDDSGAILCQISTFKDMLDHVNEEIEANIQVTRDIESEIVRCSETENVFSLKESDLTKSLFVSHFEINGLISVAADYKKSVNSLEEELCRWRRKQDEVFKRINEKREGFANLCLEFQRDISMGEKDEVWNLLAEEEFLKNEVHLLDKKNNALKNSMVAFVEEILEELNYSNSALHAEILNGNQENEKLLKEIDDLKKTLLQRTQHYVQYTTFVRLICLIKVANLIEVLVSNKKLGGLTAWATRMTKALMNCLERNKEAIRLGKKKLDRKMLQNCNTKKILDLLQKSRL